MQHVTVYPAKRSALHVKHPHGHKMKLEGVTWPKDSFTGRRLADGSVTIEKAKAYVPPADQVAEIEKEEAYDADSGSADPAN